MFQIRKIPHDYAGGGLIIHYYTYTFNSIKIKYKDRKVAVGGSILAICHGNKV